VTEQPPDPSSSGGFSNPPLGTQPTAASSAVDFAPVSRGQSLSQRPEIVIAATFVGGFILASILKRLAR
jgi:hypothetical protein